MGLSFLIFFAAGYWMAGLVIYADRMLRRVPSPIKRRMLRIDSSIYWSPFWYVS